MLDQQHTQSGSLYTRRGSRKYFTVAERQGFIAAAYQNPRPNLRTLALTLAYSGCRISEALNLTGSAIDVDGGFIAFRTLKRRNGAVVIREVPMPAHVLIDIAQTHNVAQHPPETRLWGFCRSHAWSLIKALIVAAGIAPGQHATPKGLRHALGVEGIRKGVPITLIQRWLGHASIRSTCVYLQAVGEEERRWAALLWPQQVQGDDAHGLQPPGAAARPAAFRPGAPGIGVP